MAQKRRPFFFDFDGVIIESNAIKDIAFEKIFRKYPEYSKEIFDYHFENNHVDRYQKFKHIRTNILKSSDESLERNWVIEFSRHTSNAILECPFVVGAIDLLNEAHKKFDLFLVSATPQSLLEEIVNERGLIKYFKGIHGAPIRKSAVMKQILQQYDVSSDDAYFIGDSVDDYRSSQEAKVPFFARHGRNDFAGLGIPVFKNLDEILKNLKNRGEL
jgi:phosphoglycolate phosphatase-like HAD superfamily hydrolase